MRGPAQNIRTVIKADTEIYLWPPCVHIAYPTHTPTLSGQIHDPARLQGWEMGRPLFRRHRRLKRFLTACSWSHPLGQPQVCCPHSGFLHLSAPAVFPIPFHSDEPPKSRSRSPWSSKHCWENILACLCVVVNILLFN